MIEIHCSALPRILACPASMVEVEGPKIVARNAAATIGTCVHEALALMVRGGLPDIPALARRYGLEESAIGPLYYTGKWVWEELSPELAVIGTEMELEAEVGGVLLKGKADVVGRAHQEDEPTISVIDWKSGVERDYNAQLLGYAVLVANRWPARVHWLTMVMLRTGKVLPETIAVDAAKAKADLTSSLERAVRHQDHFEPSYESCAFCPRQMDCPGRRALVRASVADLQALESEIESMPVERLAALYPKVQFVERICEHYHATVRNTVLVHGPLAVGDGRMLKMVEADRTEISARAAWDILLRGFGQEALLNAAVDVNKTAVLEMVKAQRPKGETIKAAISKFMEELENVGAVRHKTSYTLRIGKETKQNGTATDGGE